jgi:hypothetical protein
VLVGVGMRLRVLVGLGLCHGPSIAGIAESVNQT